MLRFDSSKNYYALLAISSDASKEDVNRAYRVKARHGHPDMGGSAEEMRLLNEAREVLSDAATRHAYDLEFGLFGRTSESSPSFARQAKTNVSTRIPPAYFWKLRRTILKASFCFGVGLLILTKVEASRIDQPMVSRWLLRVLSLGLFALGVVLLHSAANPGLRPAGRRLWLDRGLAWALGFALVALLVMIIYIR
ncbi:MAG TPA: J domain-containing protein [Blastocatellia bacterium]|nr:J domain-containing protein [Blastocatellia bacterium]